MAGTITDLMQQMRGGDESAIERLWRYFSPEMLRLYRPRCRTLRIENEQDVVSIAFFNLISAMTDDKVGIANRIEFWRLLKLITKRQLRDSVRYDQAQKRGGGQKVVSLQSSQTEAIVSSEQALSASDSPADYGALIQTLREVADQMDRPEFSKIIELKIQGKSSAEIARTLNISLRTTQYLIRDIKEIWLESFK